MKYKTIVALIALAQTGLSAGALGPVDETALKNAWTLHTQQKYAASADAFEGLIKTSTPNARLYYYAAVANRSSNRITRAKQLCQYVVTNFPGTTEAGYAQKLFPELAAKPSTSTVAAAEPQVPDHLKNKSVDELMQTEEGRKALKEMLGKPNTTTASASGKAPGAVATASAASPDKARGAKRGDRVFSAEDIAKEGAGGISDFSSYPDSWFECSLASMAENPRGQRLLAEMIRSGGADGSYIVRFPGDTVEYAVTPQKMDAARVKDKALWATIIHCAVMMKSQKSTTEGIEEGLTWMTGKKAEKLNPAGTTEGSLASFIRDALAAQNPVVCESGYDFGTSAELVESGHAYAVMAFDQGSGMITFKNPHGANSRRFRLKPEHPDHKKFEQLNDGVFRLHISLFPRYFSSIARSSF